MLFLTSEGWVLFWHPPPLLPTQTRSVCLPATDTWSASCRSWGSQHLPLSWLVSGLSWSSGPHIPLSTQWPRANSLKCQSDQGTLGPKLLSSFHCAFALKDSLALWNGPAYYSVFTLGHAVLPLPSSHLAFNSQVNAFSSEMLFLHFLPEIRREYSRCSKGRVKSREINDSRGNSSNLSSNSLSSLWEQWSLPLLGCLVLWNKPASAPFALFPTA